jgi:hypothetical protein
MREKFWISRAKLEGIDLGFVLLCTDIPFSASVGGDSQPMDGSQTAPYALLFK